MTERPRVGAMGRILSSLARPTDLAWLATFRVFYGLLMAVSMLRFIAYGWVDRFFVEPRFHFKYWGFSWVEPLLPDLMHALFAVLAGLAVCIAAGLFFRVAAFVFVLGFTYLQLIDVTTYLNHYYLASLLGLLLACSPAHRLWSVDAWLKKSWRRDRTLSAWLYLFRFQVAVVYTFAGLAKANADWLIHAQPLRIWLGSRTELPLIGSLLGLEGVPLAMSWAGFLFDTTVVWLLLWRKARPWAYAVLIVFHAVTRLMFPIGMFPFIMVLAALVFFEPSWPRRWLELFSRLKPFASSSVPSQAGAELGPLARWAVLLGVVSCCVQVALPLRAWAYAGDVRWHEQGMRFSWRVMVREKNGSVTFRVESEKADRKWQLSPRRYLTRLQEREMAGQPDLILQLAHHVRRDFVRRGYADAHVYVDALASLNGRRLAPMIDPRVDLSRIEDGIARAGWILPVPPDAPPHLVPLAEARVGLGGPRVSPRHSTLPDNPFMVPAQAAWGAVPPEFGRSVGVRKRR